MCVQCLYPEHGFDGLHIPLFHAFVLEHLLAKALGSLLACILRLNTYVSRGSSNRAPVRLTMSGAPTDTP